MSVEEELKRAGFRKQEEDAGDSCSICDYREDHDGAVVCKLHGINFGKDFSANDYVCREFDSSIMDSLLAEVAREYAENEMTDTRYRENNTLEEKNIKLYTKDNLVDGVNDFVKQQKNIYKDKVNLFLDQAANWFKKK